MSGKLEHSLNPSLSWTSRWHGIVVVLLLAGALFVVAATAAGQTNETIVVHFAFSKSMFREVNENDARAAMKVYCKTIGDENGIDTSFGPIYLDGANAMAEALRLKQIDIISLTTEEYLTLEDLGLDGPFLMSTVNQTVTEEYVILVRDDSPIRSVEDLKGHSLIEASDIRASLAPIWLEVLCRQHNLGPANQLFSSVTSASKVTQVVLPVFFGKVDACVTTRISWEVMGELNPQVKRQLRAIATSVPLVPCMSCFRRDYPETYKQRVVRATEGSHDKPAFKQLMALFKTDELTRQPISVLENTRQLMTTYRQLSAASNPAGAGSLKKVISSNTADKMEY